jgi:hypothetical protein
MEIRTNVRIGGNYMKRYTIKSKLRFLISVSLIMIFSMTSIFTLVVNAKGSSEVSMIPQYVEVGDTIWGLSINYNGEMDIREYISKVMDINDLHSANIKPGDLLYFPEYK